MGGCKQLKLILYCVQKLRRKQGDERPQQGRIGGQMAERKSDLPSSE